MTSTSIYAIGDRIQVRTVWGSGPVVSGTVTGFGHKNGRQVIDYRQDGCTGTNWAYADHVLPPSEFKEATHLNYMAVQDEAKRIALWLHQLDALDAKAKYSDWFKTELDGWLEAFNERPHTVAAARKSINGGSRS